MATAPASWEAAVTGRIPTTTLRALTNENSETQNSGAVVDTTVLGNSICDALGEFAVLSGMDPRLDDPSHVGVVVIGVIAYLKTYKDIDEESTQNIMNRFVFKAKAIRNIATSSPGSTTNTTPSDPAPQGREIRPDADRSNYRRFLAGNNGNIFDRYRGF